MDWIKKLFYEILPSKAALLSSLCVVHVHGALSAARFYITYNTPTTRELIHCATSHLIHPARPPRHQSGSGCGNPLKLLLITWRHVVGNLAKQNMSDGCRDQRFM